MYSRIGFRRPSSRRSEKGLASSPSISRRRKQRLETSVSVPAFFAWNSSKQRSYSARYSPILSVRNTNGPQRPIRSPSSGTSDPCTSNANRFDSAGDELQNRNDGTWGITITSPARQRNFRPPTSCPSSPSVMHSTSRQGKFLRSRYQFPFRCDSYKNRSHRCSAVPLSQIQLHEYASTIVFR